MLTRRTVLAGMLASTAFPAALRAATEPYVLGTLFPMTGLLSELGSIYTAATALGLEHVAQDKRLSQPIVLKAQDSQSTPQGGAVGMSKLANVDRAPYVLVGLTGVAKAAEPIATRAKVVMVNGGGVGPDLAGLSPYFWNIIPLANQELPTAFSWMKRNEIRRVALIYLDDPLGNALRKGLQDGLPAIGAALVGEFSAAPSAQQFSAMIAKIRETKPDLVYVASYGTQQTQIFKQLRDNGITQPLMTYSVGGTPSVAALPESEGLLFTSQVADWDAKDPLTRRFVEGWRARHKDNPSTYAQNYYNAVLLYAQLIERLEKEGKPLNGDTLREGLATGTFDLVGGRARFSPSGAIDMPTQLNRVQNGKFEKVS
ncbi:ABC transporter substrate-binding protein [Xanthobacter dioxanivorans]|uniref:ABC transporter substrate-binding protein n=1 Tax=Xanthobacter dioxanivorans TaxID=2528964 RepID=A0A974PNQ8_9HYPH|nr:ABC transporter substrate-binding protein [Xanthobacter dioxanivorans]QRG06959.1 ABC transporter substrate-binding protein [Xanthobacter dioxanivorans]